MAPRSIGEAVKSGQPISVISKVSGLDAVCNQLEFDLIKALSLLNLNLTIKEHQYPAIVRELVDMYPNESIQDFQLCFKKLVRGEYGKIYNIDLSVISLAMGEYLEEKYSYIERQNKIEQSQTDSVVEMIIEKTAETISKDTDQVKIDRSAILRDKIIGSLTDAEVKAEGQEKPVRKYASPDLARYELRERINKARIEFYGGANQLTSGWDFYDIKGESIYCASEKDAIEIYANANKF